MSPRKAPMLSKSRFVAGLQCPLRLWHSCYNRHLAAAVTPTLQALFDMGHEVGRLATELYAGGVLIEEDHTQHEEAVRRTLEVLADLRVPAIYEAAFVENDVRVRVDILKRLEGDRWNLIEVKSSTSVKDYHLFDVAVQCHVLEKAGLGIERCGVMHLNNQYEYDGQRLDLESLFSFDDLTDEVIGVRGVIVDQIANFKNMLSASAPPSVEPSRHCKRPTKCEFWEHCTRKKPEFWVMELAGISQKGLSEFGELGIEDIHDIPFSFPLTTLHARIRDCIVNDTAYLSPKVAAELTDIEYPVHFLDFETVSPGIPRYAGTRPYQTIPFQWSDHVLFEDGTIEHRSYLCEEDKDPREEFATTLLEALGDRGTIFVYTDYEKGVISELAEFLPHDRARLLPTLSRLLDLYATVRKHVYHPQFHGSFSLKSVLPALVPSMSYKELAIQDGNHASLEYLRMIDPGTPAAEKEEIKESLLRYCGYDTMGMVRIREALLERGG